MITNESEGLAKLTEYLKQTRRQAEIAIDNLNSQLSHVSNENEELRQAMKQLEQEKAEYKKLLEQLKQESSSKNKFKERDDWKCLVDSIQQDRTRLQEENNQLQAFLSTASQQIEGLKQEMEKLNDEKLELEDINKKLQFQIDELEKERQNGVSEEKGSSTREKLLIRTHSNSIDNGPNGLLETSPKSFISPVVDKSSGRQIFSFDTTSPHAIAKKLKDELLKAHAQMEDERKKAELEKLRQLAEINRLKSAIVEQQQQQQQLLLLQQNNDAPMAKSNQFVIEKRVLVPSQKQIQPVSSNRGWFGGLLSILIGTGDDSKSSTTNPINEAPSVTILKV